MTAHAEQRQPLVDANQPVLPALCPGAYSPPSAFSTQGEGKCPECSGWYRVLKSGDVGRHRPPRRRRTRDTAAIASMIRRMIDAHGRRVADGDEQDLHDLVELRYHVDVVIEHAVTALHYDQEFSWSTIGEILGVSKQAVEKRFGRR